MKIALLITTYNRPAYLKRCLASVKRTTIKDADVFIVDDCSEEQNTRQILHSYQTIFKTARKGICDSLLTGIDNLFHQDYDIVINLDADAIIRIDYFERMLELHEAFPNDIITGFHSTTKNDDGSERHEVVGSGVTWHRKRSVGGINMLWTKKTWTQMKPVIENAQTHRLNWDHQVSLASNGIICPAKSLVEHIGIETSMGHYGTPDTADGFKYLSLPDVTLVCVDDNAMRGRDALNKCTDVAEFGAVKLLSSSEYDYDEQIQRLGSKEAYSRFILKELHKYINTPYALIVQHDGYIKNPEAWLNEFMQYDYIGATWWYKDGKNVGNGGFSLRSKKLLELTPSLPTTKTHPEDEVICRDCRYYLEQRGIKFAPDELADKFSYEGYNKQGQWSGQFGFHGAMALRKPPDPRKIGFIINQFLGLGDILFLVPLIRYWMEQGHDVIWPIADEYFDIRKHFPDIQFCKKSDWPNVLYDHPTEYMHRWQYGLYQVKPLRWNLSRCLSEAMTTKYTMYGLDFDMWRGLRWERGNNEPRAEGEYILRSCYYGNSTDGGKARKDIDIQGNVIDIGYIDGYTLLDCATLIENATEIHAVSSSCIYLFETLNLKAKEIHLYSRRAGERDFEMVRPLLKRYKYIFHI